MQRATRRVGYCGFCETTHARNSFDDGGDEKRQTSLRRMAVVHGTRKSVLGRSKENLLGFMTRRATIGTPRYGACIFPIEVTKIRVFSVIVVPAKNPKRDDHNKWSGIETMDVAITQQSSTNRTTGIGFSLKRSKYNANNIFLPLHPPKLNHRLNLQQQELWKHRSNTEIRLTEMMRWDKALLTTRA